MSQRASRVLVGVMTVMALVASGCGGVTSKPRVSGPYPRPMVVLGPAGPTAAAEDATAGFCAGVLISRREVLTAARCLRKRKARSVSARVLNSGGCRVTHRRRARGATRVSTGAVTVLRLRKPVPAAIEPLALGEVPPAGAVVLAWGWGPGTPGAGCVPRPARLRVVEDEECSARVGEGGGGVHFCAVPEGRMNTCPGDLGGPVLDEEGRLVGITPTGKACGSDGPARYWSTANLEQRPG